MRILILFRIRIPKTGPYSPAAVGAHLFPMVPGVLAVSGPCCYRVPAVNVVHFVAWVNEFYGVPVVADILTQHSNTLQ